jgi:hypothetical protein
MCSDDFMKIHGGSSIFFGVSVITFGGATTRLLILPSNGVVSQLRA